MKVALPPLNPDAEPVTMPIPDKEAGPAAAAGGQ